MQNASQFSAPKYSVAMPSPPRPTCEAESLLSMSSFCSERERLSGVARVLLAVYVANQRTEMCGDQEQAGGGRACL